LLLDPQPRRVDDVEDFETEVALRFV